MYYRRGSVVRVGREGMDRSFRTAEELEAMLLTQQKEATAPTGSKLACGSEVVASGKWRARSWYVGELEVTTTTFFSNSASLRE